MARLPESGYLQDSSAATQFWDIAFLNGAPDGSFDNRANGSNLGLLAGYRWQLSPRYSLNVESKLSRSDASWKLDLPEPATFRYAVPVNFALSVLPTWQITDNFAMHLEAGIAMGRIELRKSATVTSQYDVKEWSPGAIAGFGFSFALADQWSVRLGHQRTWYKDLHFDSHLSNGTPVESIRSSTEQSTTNIALIRAF